MDQRSVCYTLRMQTAFTLAGIFLGLSLLFTAGIAKWFRELRDG